MSEKELYSTTDFYTAALLICLKYEIKKVTRENPGGSDDPQGKVRRFYYEDTDELRADILEYMNGKKSGNLREFRDAIENVKDLVHS